MIYKASCSELITSEHLLDNRARSLLGLTENETSFLLTLNTNVLGLSENSLKTSGPAHAH
jgi:hypothetical protein